MLSEGMVQDIVDQMVKAYKPECRYLKKASVLDGGRKTRGDYSIPSPCYCVGTGHFNAVELFICYNQLACVTLASVFDLGSLPSVGRVPLDEYKQYQAGNSYIASVSDIRFTRLIDPSDFQGSIDVVKERKVGDTVFLDTAFQFSDKKNGLAKGGMMIAVAFPKGRLSAKPGLEALAGSTA